VHGEDRRKNVRAALEAVDDQILPALKRKKYVLIKPNFVSSTIHLAASHPDAIRGILDYLEPRYKGPIMIAEASHEDTLTAFENFGFNRLPSEYRRNKITLLDLNQEDNIHPLVIIDRELHARQIHGAGRLFDPDAFVISSAMPKTHDGVVATLSVKNMCMGVPLHSGPKTAERWDHKSACHAGAHGLHFNIMLTAREMRPFWGAAVIDGYEGMEGQGPQHGTGVASRVAIASTDYIAADRVGLEIMGVNPAWPGYLNYCAQMALGQYDLAKIDLRGVSVESVRKAYQPGPNLDVQLEWMKPPAQRLRVI